jgi:hypothetical protein
VKEPRPRITSARPFETASRLEKRWKHPDRVVGGEHRDRRAEADALRPRGDRCEQDLGRRDGEIGAVMLAKADDIDAELVRKHRFLDDVADDLRMGQQTAVGAGGDVAERVEPQFNDVRHLRPSAPLIRAKRLT